MFVMLNNSVEDSCLSNLCRVCFLDFLLYSFILFLSILFILLYFFLDERVDVHLYEFFKFFVMMYVIRKIIITTIVKLINLILIQRINLISKNFSLLLFKIIEMQQSFLIVYKIVKKKNYWDS